MRGCEILKSSQGLIYPSVTGDIKGYVIGDIHGRSDLLGRLHNKIDATLRTKQASTVEIYLGDYVDRGPDSAGVIDRLIKRAKTNRIILLRGNHEVMFERFLNEKLDLMHWARNGGMDTLHSYGVDVRELKEKTRAEAVSAVRSRVPADHRAFLNSLCDSFSLGSYFFAHAGIRPGVSLEAQKPEDLHWIRSDFINDDRDHGAIVVHGHTPTEVPEFLPNRINIDTGAYMTGRLTCLEIDNWGLRLFTGEDGLNPENSR